MTHIELLWWWMLVLLPLPYFVLRWWPPVRQRAAIHLAYLPPVSQRQSSQNNLQKLLAILIWCFLVLAASRPVWYGEPLPVQSKHRDVMLVVDLSYSMSQQDMQRGNRYIDRLTAVKQVLSDFIDKREGDRLGLVLFADHAYLQTPLTLDRQTIKQQLNQMVLKLIGTQTAIGEGIGLAVKTFIDDDAPQRVMILLSDGTNNAGVLDPIEAAHIAKKYHATIYTVGVGAGEMQVNDLFYTRTVNTAEDLDEKTLTEIANITGGRYFRARNSHDLASIYDTINQLEPISQVSQIWRPQTEWFALPLLAALALSIILMGLRRDYV